MRLRLGRVALAVGALLGVTALASCAWNHGGRAGTSRDVPCMSAGECPWSGNPCVVPTCSDNRCGNMPAPEGLVPEGQIGGDCRESYCDGQGRELERAKDDDPPLDDTDPCTEPICKGMKVAHDPTDVGTPCGQDGLCNGKGACGICMPGVKRCNGNAVDSCSDDGQWAGATDCAGATPICTNATCMGVVEIASGDDHTCARLTDGSVRCWGDDSLGQLGDRGAPRPLPGLAGVAQVAFGSGHACARLGDGSVACWGENEFGQLGDGSGDDRPFPAPVPKLAGVAQIATGAFHTCARLADGSVKCWGDDDRGQLGDDAASAKKAPLPGFTGRGKPTQPRPVAELANVSSLALGYSRSCANGGGGLVCWGEPRPSVVDIFSSAAAKPPKGAAPPPPSHHPPPNHGGKPAPPKQPSPSPRPPKPPPPSKPPPATKAHGKASPVDVKGLKGVADVHAGWMHTCARMADGTVACWGSNEFGQLGDGSKTDRKTPVPVKGLTGVAELAVGADHACARLGDGSVRCWGRNDAAQVGDGSRENRSEPVALAGVTGVAELVAGGGHACARLAAGSVTCWGDGGPPAKIVW